MCRRGLLFDKLETTGNEKIERLAKEKEQEWKNTTGKIMKVPAAEIQARIHSARHLRCRVHSFKCRAVSERCDAALL
jgi:hypothetical protein